jgi:hypothetical protein
MKSYTYYADLLLTALRSNDNTVKVHAMNECWEARILFRLKGQHKLDILALMGEINASW